MTQAIPDPALIARRQEWIQRVQAVVNEMAQWAAAEGWAVSHDSKSISEPLLGTYNVPTLEIHLQGGQLLINPIGSHIVGGNGRVDIEAVPTLNRVKLISAGAAWTIMTDSNVPLSDPWNAQTFISLAHHLLA